MTQLACPTAMVENLTVALIVPAKGKYILWYLKFPIVVNNLTKKGLALAELSPVIVNLPCLTKVPDEAATALF